METGGNIMGKGSTPRPVDKKKYDENYKRIFYCPKCGKHKNECKCVKGESK